jgi:hypothetical protein
MEDMGVGLLGVLESVGFDGVKRIARIIHLRPESCADNA